jgi:DUF971 family protein
VAGDRLGRFPSQPLIADTMAAPAPSPTSVTVHQASRVLEVGFDDGRSFRIPFELMRVYSPSAEVQGHGPGQETLQTGKRDVLITDVVPVGHYALQPRFSDGHESGIFTWTYLYELGAHEAELWARYEERLRAAGVDRDAPMAAAGGHACGHH